MSLSSVMYVWRGVILLGVMAILLLTQSVEAAATTATTVALPACKLEWYNASIAAPGTGTQLLGQSLPVPGGDFQVNFLDVDHSAKKPHKYRVKFNEMNSKALDFEFEVVSSNSHHSRKRSKIEEKRLLQTRASTKYYLQLITFNEQANEVPYLFSTVGYGSCHFYFKGPANVQGRLVMVAAVY
jgi:hypothetical protein